MNITLSRLDPHLPDPVESRRRAAGRMVRIAYATIVFGVLAFIVVYFGRAFVYLSGPGVVASPLTVVSLPYTVQVKQMKVTRGARVTAGQEIGGVWSPQLDDVVATYMRALAEVNARSADLRIKARAARESLEASRSYLRATEEATKHLDTSTTASLTFRLEMLRERALAQKTVAAQEAEVEEASIQLASLDNFTDRLRQHLDELEHNFDGGRILAPIAGIISTVPAREGQSVLAGTPIAEILNSSDVFVNWYIPNERFTDPEVGDQVAVVFGNWRLQGTITEILPVSDVYGGSQSSPVRVPVASQIARVRFSPNAVPPALNSTVDVHMYYTHFAASVAGGLVRLFRLGRG
jgi:multidrug resistance efflux pump